MLYDLYTTAGENLCGQPWQSYPRPQLRRQCWLNLNGEWDFTVRSNGTLPRQYDRHIRVPFPPESMLSGIHEHFAEGSYLFYRRRLTLPETVPGGRILLHIGAADQIADIYVNQKYVASHTGGYEAMTFDITDFLCAENELVIRVQDDLRSTVMPYGKQVMKRGGMWYTPVSGIWQTVWLEPVPERYIQGLIITNTADSAVIDTGDSTLDGVVSIQTPEGEARIVLEGGKATYQTKQPRMWSPEDPYLYQFTVETADDRVESYFALRTLTIQNVDGYARLCLNGKPYFFHGLLDQGYWPDGLFTPAAPECYGEDILAMKKLGFNMLRKLIKVEPEQFYYDCDRLGMVVFQDMVNNGPYSFFRDTALPTVGIQKLPDQQLHRNRKIREAFLRGMEATVAQLRNHPSICYWTIFNEGWGQFDSDRVCTYLRELDCSRFIDATSGWFRRSNTDVDSRHIYFKPLKLKAGEKPLVLSEFGGYSYKPDGHVFNGDQTYGYKKFGDPDAFMNALEALYTQQVVPLVKQGLCAAVYTQVSDVEDETNGLLSYDRKVLKVEEDRMQAVAALLRL